MNLGIILGIIYELSYDYQGVRKIVSFEMDPALVVLTKEVVMEPGQTSKEFQLNISSITGYCDTVEQVAYTLKIGADRTLSSNNGVVVRLKSYDATKGVIVMTVDASAATIAGDQDVFVKTVNDSVNETRTGKFTIRNIGMK